VRRAKYASEEERREARLAQKRAYNHKVRKVAEDNNEDNNYVSKGSDDNNDNNYKELYEDLLRRYESNKKKFATLKEKYNELVDKFNNKK